MYGSMLNFTVEECRCISPGICSIVPAWPVASAQDSMFLYATLLFYYYNFKHIFQSLVFHLCEE
jgi:hypothetical protein